MHLGRAAVTTVFLLGLTLSARVSAQTDVSSWNRDIERTDFYEDPPQNGDNNFFTGISNQSATTNVTLVYTSKATMNQFTQKLYRIRVDLGGTTPTGCTNTYLNNLTYFMPASITPPAGASSLQGTYSAGKTYPDPGPTYSGGSGQSDGLTSSGTKTYYRYGNWPAGSTAGTSEDETTACTNAGGAAQAAACKACLDSSGYWLNPLVTNNDTSTAAGVFTTNWLRFHPVKWVISSLAYKRLVNGPLLSVLREAVVTQAADQGGQVTQKMLPQSCNGQGRPMNQKLGAIDGIAYTDTSDPLAEMLFNTGWYMGGQNNPWAGTSGTYFTSSTVIPGSAMATGKSGPCSSCSGDFIVLFSDGRGDTANPSCTSVLGFTPPACQAAAQCSTLGMGTELDGDTFLDPSVAGGAGTLITGSSVRQTPGGTCDMDFADDVAYWMANNAMGGPGYPSSTIKTYVVGIGDPNNTYGEMTALQQVATQGGGEYVVADDFQNLEANIEHVMTSIITRATSFSAAAITTVQTHGYTSAFIPRFKPASGAQWSGTLSRYQLFNEFAAGCTSADYGTKDTNNPNGNSSCYDIYLTDANNAFIGEDSNGQFNLVDTTQAWDGGWPIKTYADGGEQAATPFWEAASSLTTRENNVIGGATSSARTIYTVAPNGTTGSYSSTLVPFSVANVSNITPLLKLGGVNGDLCTTLSHMTRHTYSTEDDCATDVINFIHGQDVLLQNPYNRTNPQPSTLQARPKILGDIFHSTPVLVTPPVPTFLCDLGVANQCVASLYGSNLEPGGTDAYNTYITTWQYRTEFVLVGSNDGLVHAFNAGNDTTTGTVHSFDLGTGQEMWAFIPPDLMPKLIRYVIGERHELMADGTPMVRDIWVDGSGSTTADHAKQSDEYHTVAVLGEREGGRSYSALDVTDPYNPKFLWTWPPPGTTASLNKGQSWADLGPAAPPIGPIAEADTSGAFSVNIAGVATKARERYVFATGGGYDASYLRGRSFYVLDAWTGAAVYRFSREDASGASDARSNLYPVVAPASLLDTDNDGIFDAAVFGDTGGQVWTVNMQTPGTPGSGNLYTNWYGGRSFIQFKGSALYHRSPFFQRAVAALLPGNYVRVFIGSGDRAQIKDPNGGTCSVPNLSACIRKNCGVTTTATYYRVGAAPTGSTSGHYVNSSWSYAAGGTSMTTTMPTDILAQSASSTDVDDDQLDYSINCGGTTSTFQAKDYCDWAPGVDGGTECTIDTGRPESTTVDYTPAVTLENSRFYSFKLFDNSTRAQFTTSSAASTYDGAALTDTDLVNAATTTTTASANGWYLVHNNSTDEKTSSSGLLLGGCMIWNTLFPNPVQTVSCGGTLPLDTAYTYQADATTGAIACGEAGSSTYTATARFSSRNTYVAPQQPATVISVNSATGQVAFGGVSIEPGAPPSSITVGTNDLVGTVHWLEVPRKVHECRHNGTNCQ